MFNRHRMVVNLRDAAPDSGVVYIGRKGKDGNGYFGNPHHIGWCRVCKCVHSRLQAIEAFREDFNRKVDAEPVYRERIEALRGKLLGCFCRPLMCHGDVIVEWLYPDAETKEPGRG